MFLYYLRLALKNIASKPQVSAIAVLGIALGISVATSMNGMRHLFTQNPLPEKSEVLFNVAIDSFDPNREFFAVKKGDPPKAQTYQDHIEWMKSDIPIRQTATGNAQAYVFPNNPAQKPYNGILRLTTSDFFSMFNVPFKYGQGWDASSDENRAPIVVLSEKANQKLFNGENSVGKSIRIGSLTYRICGVLDHYWPNPKFYDLINTVGGEPREFFVPLNLITSKESGLQLTGDTDGWGPSETFQGDDIWYKAELYWLQHWVELPTSQKVSEFNQYLDNYVAKIKALGRHPRPVNNRLLKLTDYVHSRNTLFILGPVNVLSILSILFLLVCTINLMGLLMARFLAKSSMIGVHRAMGASMWDVFFFNIIECSLIGVMGGAVGLPMTLAILKVLEARMPNMGGRIASNFLYLDWHMVGMGLCWALLAGILSGLYPAWRACRMSPAIQLKA